jgi:hypothetical protein
MSESKPWIKLWARWYETMSHSDLIAEALHTGPHLLVIAGKHGRREDGSAALVGPDGAALRIADLARRTRWSTRKMAEIVADLRRVGTLAVEGDAFVFPKFQRWQESASASRVRRHRAVTVTPKKRTKREDRGERTEDRPSTPPPTSGLAPVPDSPAEREQHAIEWLRDRLPSARRPDGCNALYMPDAKLRELLRAGAAPSDVIATVEAFADAIEEGHEKRENWRGNYVLSLAWFEQIQARYVTRDIERPAARSLADALEHEERTGSLPAGWQRVADGVVGPGGKHHEVEARC